MFHKFGLGRACQNEGLSDTDDYEDSGREEREEREERDEGTKSTGVVSIRKHMEEEKPEVDREVTKSVN